MQDRTLSQFVATTLADRASFLAHHWLDRAQVATPRRAGFVGRPAGHGADGQESGHQESGHQESGRQELDRQESDRAQAERVMRVLADEVLASSAAAAILSGTPADSTAALMLTDARPSAEVMQLGWRAGGAAFAAGLSVHHVMRDADLLLAIVLTDLERAVGTLPPDVAATPAEALAVARRLQRGAGRYATAAVSGFVQALLHSMRERYRLLRHDLRNPLGTIRSALSLMEDESVPEAMRHGPGIRAMVARNAGSLDQLIARGLDDDAAALLLTPPQDVALRDVIVAVRREVREAARLAGCAIVVGDVPEGVPLRTDTAGFELTLTALLLAGLTHATPGDELRIDCLTNDADASPASARSLVVRVGLSHGAPRAAPHAGESPRWDLHGLMLAASLAADHGGTLSATPAAAAVATGPDGNAPSDPGALVDVDAIYLRLPFTADAPPREKPGVRAGPASGAPASATPAG